MGRIEAELDGIEMYYDPKRGYHGHRGAYVYKVPCSVCGELTETVTYGRSKKYVCAKCKCRRVQHKQEVERAWFEVIEEKGERRYNKALDEIQRQVKNFEPYRRAAETARKAQDKYGSVPEAMVAVELLRLGFPFIPQQKIGRYRVDFYVPKIGMVIEVDGEVFHRKRTDRDATIQFAIGLDKKILHIPAELIARDIRKLKPLIEKRLELP